MAPSLFGSDLLDNINVFETVFASAIRFESVDRVQIAASAMVIADHFEGVLYTTKNEIRSKNVSDCSIREL